MTNDRIQARMDHMAEHQDEPYSIKFTIEYGNFARDAVKDIPHAGLTQDLLMISCITQPNGSYTQNWATYDGLTQKPLPHDDVFKAWIMMAAKLREKTDLHDFGRMLCHNVFEAWAEAMFQEKAIILPPEPKVIM